MEKIWLHKLYLDHLNPGECLKKKLKVISYVQITSYMVAVESKSIVIGSKNMIYTASIH